jgi:acetyl esterase/lipase
MGEFKLPAFVLTCCALLTGCAATGLALFNAVAPDVSRVRDIEFAPGARGHMDLYAPPGSATADTRPLVVFWYGGAWQAGSRKDYRFVGAALAARGFVAVIPDYRLHPEVRFPDFLRDAAAAVARAQREAPNHGADPRRTVLGGHSAGAYIAAMLALQPAYLHEAGVDPASIAGFFGLSGPYAVDPNSDALHAIFTQAAGPETYQAVPQASALAPPALLVHGTADDVVYPAHTEKLAAALRDKGVAVEVRIVPGRGHADTVAALSRPGGYRIPDLLEQVSAFIARVGARSAATASYSL